MSQTSSEWAAYVKGTQSAQLPEHPPDLYRFDRTAHGITGGFDAVDEAALKRFGEEGFLVIHDAFTPGEVRDAIDGLRDLIDGKNPDFKGIQFEAAIEDHVAGLSSSERQDAVRKLMFFAEFEPRLKAMSHHPRLLALVERLVGEAPAMFQDMALLKPPRIGREKPWHQDCAYFDIPPNTPVVGVWVALDDATLLNGCMHVIPGSHRGGPATHFARRDWQICDTAVDASRDTAVPLKSGGLLMFSGLLHHGTPTNRSPHRRRAMQFHYRPASCAPTTTAERLAVFGPEGKDVEC